MNDQQWGKAWEIYQTARELGEDERRSFLASIQTDPAVLDEVVAMLEEPAEQVASGIETKVGTRLSHYEILAVIGSGGMGQDFSARDTELGRTVALKYLSSETVASRSAVERLIREAKATS